MMFKALPKRKPTVRRKTKRYMWCVLCMSKREREVMCYVICVLVSCLSVVHVCTGVCVCDCV